MKKIQFTLQILLLVLAFPVWFIAEIKHDGKVLQKGDNRGSHPGIEKKATEQLNGSNLRQAETVTMPDTVQLLVNN